MRTVGIRELKDHLSDYLRQARAGELIVITDRGEPVAELSPAGTAGDAEARVPSALAFLARQGRATIGSANDRASYPLLKPLMPPGAALQILDEKRHDRCSCTLNRVQW